VGAETTETFLGEVGQNLACDRNRRLLFLLLSDQMSEVGVMDNEDDRWVDLHNVVTTPGPFAQESFEGGEDVHLRVPRYLL
jgi:hypothetical protein